METSVTFTSTRFRPILPDECQVNPERYGAELAYWLCTELAGQGVMTSYPNYEDWGWFIEYIDGDDEYWLCCSNVDDADDEWLCFIEPQRRSLLGKKAPIENARVLLKGLKAVLEAEPSVTNIEWGNINTD